MQIKTYWRLGLVILLIILLSGCSGGPKNKVEYIVVNITTDHVEGFRHNLRNAETGRPAFVHFPDIRFTKGDRVLMKRTRKTVSFELVNPPLY